LLATDYFPTLEFNQTLYPQGTQIPSPDLAAHGLDSASVDSRLCVRVVIDDLVVPNLGPNASGTLTVLAGASFAGGPTLFTPSVGVQFCANTGSPGTSASSCNSGSTRTNAAGQASFPVTATASRVVRYQVCASVHPTDFLGLALASPVLGLGGVVVTPSQTTIAAGASRQFTAVVEETSD
jgi:hypothetical protein